MTALNHQGCGQNLYHATAQAASCKKSWRAGCQAEAMYYVYFMLKSWDQGIVFDHKIQFDSRFKHQAPNAKLQTSSQVLAYRTKHACHMGTGQAGKTLQG